MNWNIDNGAYRTDKIMRAAPWVSEVRSLRFDKCFDQPLQVFLVHYFWCFSLLCLYSGTAWPESTRVYFDNRNDIDPWIGGITYQFFNETYFGSPWGGGDQQQRIYITIRTPQGTPLEEIDKMARNLRSWLYVYKHKMRAVLITTLTTIGGLLPLIIMEGSDFWQTLAAVVVWGLGASTLLILLLMGLWEKPKKAVR